MRHNHAAHNRRLQPDEVDRAAAAFDAAAAVVVRLVGLDAVGCDLFLNEKPGGLRAAGGGRPVSELQLK